MAIAGTAIAATAANSKTENSTISTKNQVVETRQQDSGNTENEENLLYGKIKKITKDTVELESVIMYSLGNEIPEIGIRRGQEICRMLHEKVKQLDSTRYTTVAVNGVFSVGDVIPEIVEDVLGQECVKKADGNVNEFLTLMDQNVNQIVVHDKISERVANAAEIVDVCGYNYMIARYEKDVMEYPDRMIVGSETYPPEIGRIWGVIQEYPQIIGDFTWTGWEYIGEAGLGIPAFAPGEGGFGARFPSQLAYSGSLFTWR